MDSVRSRALELVRQHQQRCNFVPFDHQPGDDLAAAYQIQALYVHERQAGRPWSAAGWKIGLNSQKMQERCGLSEPVAGVIRDHDVRQNHAALDGSGYSHLGLEMEICVRMGAGVGELRDFTPEAIATCIDAFGAAFEIVDDRNADYSKLEGFTLAADNVWNEGVVLAAMVPYRSAAPIAGRTGVLLCNGQEIARGEYGAENGDLAALVAWLAKSLNERGTPLQPGQIVMTGTLFFPVFPQPGDSYTYEVEGLEPVTLTVS